MDPTPENPPQRIYIVVHGLLLGVATGLRYEQDDGTVESIVFRSLQARVIYYDLVETSPAFSRALASVNGANSEGRLTGDRTVIRGSRERLTRILQTLSCALSGSGRYEDDGVVVEVEGANR